MVTSYLVSAVAPGDVVEAEDGHVEEGEAEAGLSDLVIVVSPPAGKHRGHLPSPAERLGPGERF